MEPIRLDADLIRYLAILGAIIGAVLGLAALWMARKRNKTKLGVAALICCTIGGAISPLIGLIVFFIFFWLIRKKPADETPAEAAEPTDSEPS